MIRGLVEDHARVAANPGQLLTQINRALSVILKQAGTTMFATCFYLVADVQRAELRFANAGHPVGLRLQRGTITKVEALCTRTANLLSVWERMKVKATFVTM